MLSTAFRNTEKGILRKVSYGDICQFVIGGKLFTSMDNRVLRLTVVGRMACRLAFGWCVFWLKWLSFQLPGALYTGGKPRNYHEIVLTQFCSQATSGTRRGSFQAEN